MNECTECGGWGGTHKVGCGGPAATQTAEQARQAVAAKLQDLLGADATAHECDYFAYVLDDDGLVAHDERNQFKNQLDQIRGVVAEDFRTKDAGELDADPFEWTAVQLNRIRTILDRPGSPVTETTKQAWSDRVAEKNALLAEAAEQLTTNADLMDRMKSIGDRVINAWEALDGESTATGVTTHLDMALGALRDLLRERPARAERSGVTSETEKR